MKNQPIRHATQLLKAGRLQSVDVTIVSLFFWNSWGNGKTRARWSVARLAEHLQLTHWKTRKALARLQSAGLLSKATTTRLARQGFVWIVLGKAAYRKQKRAKARKPQPRPVTRLEVAPPAQPVMVQEVEEKKGPPLDFDTFFASMRKALA